MDETKTIIVWPGPSPTKETDSSSKSGHDERGNGSGEYNSIPLNLLFRSGVFSHSPFGCYLCHHGDLPGTIFCLLLSPELFTTTCFPIFHRQNCFPISLTSKFKFSLAKHNLAKLCNIMKETIDFAAILIRTFEKKTSNSIIL